MRVPRLRPYQIVLEALCLIFIIAGLVFTLIKYPSLPAEIPGHYNAAGQVTDYSGKGFIWLLEGINMAMYAMMTVFIFIPAVIENPNTTWPMNPAAKAATAAQTISLLGETKLECVLMFDYMLIPIVNCTPMNTWPIWGIVGVMAVGITLRMIKMHKVSAMPKRPWER